MPGRRVASTALTLLLLVASTGSAAARVCDERAASSAPASSVSAAVPGPDSSTKLRSQPERRRFWVSDHHYYRSDWYAGKHHKMIAFGCTRAPYYSPDPRCKKDRGFHHGIDIAMACGTRLFAGLRGTVVGPKSPGSLGPAYGPNAFRLRNSRLDKDFVIGHVRTVYVRPGDHVARGTLIALASDAGAPDGCHLHFEVRPAAAGYDAAIAPRDYIRLR